VCGAVSNPFRGRVPMVDDTIPRNQAFTLAGILLIAWLLGIAGTHTIGAAVRVLLFMAMVLWKPDGIAGLWQDWQRRRASHGALIAAAPAGTSV